MIEANYIRDMRKSFEAYLDKKIEEIRAQYRLYLQSINVYNDQPMLSIGIDPKDDYYSVSALSRNVEGYYFVDTTKCKGNVSQIDSALHVEDLSQEQLEVLSQKGDSK